MYGTVIAIFALALMGFTSISALFIKLYDAKTDMAMLSAALLRRIHIAAAFTSIPFALGQFFVVVFASEEKMKMWLTLTVIIPWGLALLITAASVIRKDKGNSKKP